MAWSSQYVCLQRDCLWLVHPSFSSLHPSSLTSLSPLTSYTVKHSHFVIMWSYCCWLFKQLQFRNQNMNISKVIYWCLYLFDPQGTGTQRAVHFLWMACQWVFPWCPQKTEKRNGMSVPLIWLFCFVVDPVAWVCIHSQFLQALAVKPGMRVLLPTPICSIVHSKWLSLTHTASCLRGSHEPVLPPRKETIVTHGPVSHDYTVQTQKACFTK